MVACVTAWEAESAFAHVEINSLSATPISFTLQDSVFFIPQQPDSQLTGKDSLEKLVPYLDKVNADSEHELILLYMLLIMLATLFSEDLAAIGAGLMAAQGMIPFWPAATATVLGIYVGDYSLYAAGRILGDRIFKVPPFKWMVTKEQIYRAEAWFAKKGPAILVISRFIPGSRLPVYLSAGILKTSFWKFFFYFGVTTLFWTPVFVWLSVIAGNELLRFYEAYEHLALWIIVGVVLIFGVIVRIVLPKAKSKLEIED